MKYEITVSKPVDLHANTAPFFDFDRTTSVVEAPQLKAWETISLVSGANPDEWDFEGGHSDRQGNATDKSHYHNKREFAYQIEITVLE